jgi:hypothetical protein
MKYIVLSLLLLITPIAFSADYAVSICALQSHSNTNSAFFKVCEARQSVNGCQSGAWIAWNMNEFQGQAMYSTALAALASGLNIIVRLNGADCIGQYDETSMMRIVK